MATSWAGQRLFAANNLLNTSGEASKTPTVSVTEAEELLLPAVNASLKQMTQMCAINAKTTNMEAKATIQALVQSLNNILNPQVSQDAVQAQEHTIDDSPSLFRPR